MRFSDTLRWLLGGLISLIGFLVLMAFNTVKADVEQLKVEVPIHGNKIAIIDTNYNNQDRKLDRIQSDLDWLVKREIEHQHPQGPTAKGRGVQ